MMRKVWICSIRVRGCLILTAVWGMLAVPGSALAAPKEKCSDGKDNDRDGFVRPTLNGTG